VPRLVVAHVGVGTQEHLLFFWIRAESFPLLKDSTFTVERRPRNATFLRKRGRGSERGKGTVSWHDGCMS